MSVATIDALEAIAAELETRSIRSAGQAAELIRLANLTPQDLHPWQEFDHPVVNSYGRKLVYQGRSFELMVMSWLPGDFSEIHDHGQAQWGAVQIFGPAQHLTFELRGSLLKQISSEVVQPGTILGVSHELIHQMGNRGNERFLSLHLYGTVEPSERITGGARIYDVGEGCIKQTDGGVFFALAEEQILSRQPGLKTDHQVLAWHRARLNDRLQRIRQ